MKIENKLTLTHIRLNKKRTALTVFGIVISVAMIVSVLVGMASFLDYNRRMIISFSGNYHFTFNGISSEKLDVLRNDDRIESIGLDEQGRKDTSGVRIENAKSLRHSTAYINWYDSGMFRQMPVDDLVGEFPKNNKEILVSREYIERNGFDWEIGDTITLQTGRRHPNDETDFFHITNAGQYQYGEVFDFYENRSFKISGIINDESYDCQMYSVCDDDSVYAAHVQLKKVTPFSIKTIYDIVLKMGIKPDKMAKNGVFLNDELLATYLCGSADSDMVTKYIPMGFIILLIILIAAFMLINNTFAMSVSERTRYLGMLSSVGATKRQKRNSTYFEGVVLGLIGIPAGLVLGIIIILFGLKLINNAGFTDIPISLVMPLWSVAAAVILSVFTIFISLYVPAKKSSRVSAIDAIRQSETVKVKSTGNAPLIKKIFGIEGVLAYKNMRRNGGKSRLITVSIAVSAILFLCVNYFCSLTTALVIDDINKPYQVEFAIPSYADRNQIIKDIKNIDGVKNVYSIDSYFYSYGKADFDHSYDQQITMGNNTTRKYKNLWDDAVVNVNYIDDKDFDALCAKNGIDPAPYYEFKDNRQKCVIMNNIDHKEKGDKVFNENIIGGVLTSNPYQYIDDEHLYDSIGIDEWTQEDKDAFLQETLASQIFADIAGIVEYDKDNYACNLNRVRTISAYAPFSMSPMIILDDGEYNILYGVETDNHQEVSEAISLYYDDHPDYANDGSAWVSDFYGYALKSIQMNKVIKIFMYGFILLITMITFVNIINTITTNVASRRREFAVIKSVGITPKDFEKMVSLESVFYGGGALMLAIPVSIGINLLLNNIVGDGKIPYDFNFVMYAIVIIAVSLFVGTTMLYAIRKIKNDNIIENIKNDIL